MKYKELYKELAQTLTDLGCFVFDIDVFGHCKHSKGSRAFIFIKSSMTYQQKFYVLAHEAGHLFFMKKGQKLVWSTKGRSENKANRFALQLLNFNDIDSNEYRVFYNRALKKIKNRKKSWFEI